MKIPSRINEEANQLRVLAHECIVQLLQMDAIPSLLLLEEHLKAALKEKLGRCGEEVG